VDEIQKGLDSAKAFIRSEVRKAIQIRKIPEVFFVFDPSIREGDRMLNLLKKIEPRVPPAAEPTPPSEDSE
jgi:ribosome-binding factor A